MIQVTDFSSRRGKGRGFASLADALWSRVVAGPGRCLIYDYNIDAYGYGQVSYKPHAPYRMKAHRVSWELRHGSIPDGLELDHLPTCDKRCVNTDHLTLRTRSEHQKVTMRRQEERPSNMHPYVDGCTQEDCERAVYAQGLCGMHYQRRRNGTPMDLPPLTRSEAGQRAAEARWGTRG